MKKLNKLNQTDNKEKLNFQLPRLETFIYFILWIGSVLYGIYRVYLCSQELSADEDLVAGWSFINRKQDISDNEWNNLKAIAPILLRYIFVQIILCELVAFLINSQAVIIPYILVPLAFCMEYFGFRASMLLLVQPLIFYIITIFNSPISVWLISAFFLFSINNLHGLRYIYMILNISPFKFYFAVIIIAWMNLKCTSFALDCVNFYNNIPTKHPEKNIVKRFYNSLRCKESEKQNNADVVEYYTKYSLFKMLAHCFFLPTLITGPVILFETFEEGMFNGFGIGNYVPRYKTFFMQLLRYVFWIVFIDFCLHFIYSSVMIFHPQWVATLAPWEIYGFGYLMGQFFYMKYLVSYGLAKTFTNLSGIKGPNPPKCIGGIHLYSDMWRYFDEGLYLYLVKYFYKPIIKLQIFKKEFLNSFVASFICFAFVYAWHGTKTFILVWSSLNFIGITIEGISRRISQQEYYKNLINTYLNNNWKIRWNAIISAPLLAMSAVSNFYFFAGIQIGNIFANKILFGDIPYCIITLFFYYCTCQACQYIKEKRTEKMLQQNEKLLHDLKTK